MARPQTRYVCQECGAAHPKWAGKCEACGAWNSLLEETAADGPKKSVAASGGSRSGRAIELVPGSALLVGGDPGIGKSTLLLQAVAALASRPDSGGRTGCAYVSGEEAI